MTMRFIKLANHSKFPIKGVSWTDPANQYTFDEIKPWVEAGNNYGAVCGYNRLVVLDIDRVEECTELGIPVEDDTLTVKTGSGGLHLYYQVEIEKPRRVVFSHPDKTHLGELQGYGQYVVAPWSTHPNGNQYTILGDNRDISEKWTYKQLIERFTDAGCLISTESPENTTRRTPKPDSSGIGSKPRAEDHPFHVTDIWPISGFKQVGNQYCGVHPVHGSDHGHNLVIDPTSDVWRCFRCNSGGGPLEALAIDAGVIQCHEAQRGALRGKLFKQMSHEAKKRGLLDKYLN